MSDLMTSTGAAHRPGPTQLIDVTAVLAVMDEVSRTFGEQAASPLGATLVQAAVWLLTTRVQALPRYLGAAESNGGASLERGTWHGTVALPSVRHHDAEASTQHAASRCDAALAEAAWGASEPVRRARSSLPHDNQTAAEGEQAKPEKSLTRAVAAINPDSVSQGRVEEPTASPDDDSASSADAGSRRTPQSPLGVCAVGSRLAAAGTRVAR